MQQFFDDVSVLDSDNNLMPLAGASVTVYETGTANLATIYSDNGITPLANPFTGEDDGSFSFYAADGRYDVLVHKSPYRPVKITDILLEDPSTSKLLSIASSISDGDTTHSPDGNSVFDALALKAPLASPSFTTQISTPSIITASGALSVTPSAGNNFNVALSGAGDFVVNTNHLYVDTSTSRVGIGTASPSSTLDVRGSNAIISVSSDSVTHGMTGIAATNICVYLGARDTKQGGVDLWGLTQDAATNPMVFSGVSGSATPSVATFIFRGGKKNGTSWQALATTEKVIQFRNFTTDLITILGNGNTGFGTTSPSSKIAINGGLHVGGDSDAGDNNLLVDGTGTITGAFGCNGKTAQTAYAHSTGDADSKIAAIEAALLANGIMS